MKIVIVTVKTWNIENAKMLISKSQDIHKIYLITEKEDLTYEVLERIEPDYIFFPHWSFYIPEEIYSRWKCIVFHMTDLPYGRGGSPLQNLIVRGVNKTVISAIEVVKEIDAGPVYLKYPLELVGSADTIFRRASDIIFNEMIPRFMEEKLIAVEQEGEVVKFKRRTKTDGEIKKDMPMETLYDYIRMLDAEGYPNAYMKFGEYIFEFSDADLKGEVLEAHVRIVKEN